MSRPSPYNLTICEDGLSVHVELDVHYITDEQLETVRKHVETLQTENDKLRELVAKARDPQRIGGTADPESFVYAIEQLREFRWQHATNDEDAIPYINNVADAHERENAKLRELVRDVVLLAGCEGCDVTKMQMHVHGGDWRTVWERMSELGVPGTEVDHD